MRIIQTSDKSIGKHYLVLDDNGDSIKITTPTLMFKQIIKEDGKYFIEVYIGKKKKFKKEIEEIISFIRDYSIRTLELPLIAKRFEFLSHGAADERLYASHCESVELVKNCAVCTNPVPVA